MKKQDFIRAFEEMLDLEPGSLHPETSLNALAAWDSVAYLSALVLIDEQLGIQIRPNVIYDAETFADILVALQDSFGE